MASQNDIVKVRWKTQLCPAGESCWCRSITTEEPLFDENGAELYVVAAAAIHKADAEHIVELHNDALGAKKNSDEFIAATLDPNRVLYDCAEVEVMIRDAWRGGLKQARRWMIMNDYYKSKTLGDNE